MSLTITTRSLATILIASSLSIAPQLASAQETPCGALTQPAVQAVIATIGRSRAQAQLDADANGISGKYAVAAVYNLAYLQDAERQFQDLDAWLVSNGLYTPFVNNASAAYQIHGVVREVSNLLHYARHWASISTAYHLSSSARSSITLTGEALTSMDPLGASAVACYVSFVGL